LLANQQMLPPIFNIYLGMGFNRVVLIESLKFERQFVNKEGMITRFSLEMSGKHWNILYLPKIRKASGKNRKVLEIDFWTKLFSNIVLDHENLIWRTRKHNIWWSDDD